MLELFDKIFHLEFEWLFANYNDAIYVILFMVIFVETGLVVFPFLPGDSLLFFAGLNARAGHLELSTLFLLLFVAAVLGDNINYWVGRKIGLRVFNLKIRNRRLVKQEYLDKTNIFFEKYGTKAIIMARFVPFVRTFAPFAAGVGRMDYRRYVLFDILGGLLWIGGLLSAGYLLGNIEFIRNHVDLVCLAIIGVSVLPIIIQFVKVRFAKNRV
jgi:membrane-associated protein